MTGELADETTPEHLSGWERALSLAIRAAVLLLLIYRLGVWVLATLFWPIGSNLGNYAYRTENALTRLGLPEDGRRFPPGHLSLVRFLNQFRYEFRTPVLHLVDDALLVGLVLCLIALGRAAFRSVWPGVLAGLLLAGQMWAFDFDNLSDRDWYAIAFSVFGLTVAALRRGPVALTIGIALWSFSLQFRPQPIVLWPLFAAAFLADALALRDWSGLLRRSLGLAAATVVGFLIANVPLILDGGFSTYYLSTFGFLSKGGYEQMPLSVDRIARNFLRLGKFQNGLMILTLAGLCAFVLVRRNVRPHGFRVFCLLYLNAVCFAWAAVNPVVNPYHMFPLVVANALAWTYAFGLLGEAAPDSGMARVFGLTALAAFVFAFNHQTPALAGISLVVPKLKSGDYTPHYVASDFKEPFPLASWKITDEEWKRLNDTLAETVEASGLPFEIVQFKRNDLSALQFPLSNPPILPEITGPEGIVVGAMYYDKARMEELTGELVRNLAEAKDAYVLWLPHETDDPEVKEDEAKWKYAFSGPVSEALRLHYAPEKTFGRLELWRRKK